MEEKRVPLNLKKASKAELSLRYKFSMIILSILLMFSYLVDDYQNLLIFLFCVVFAFGPILKLKIDKSDCFWLMYVVVLLAFGLLRENDKLNVIKKATIIMIFIFIKMLIQGISCLWIKFLSKLLVIGGVIHSVAVVFELFNPYLIRSINRIIGVETIIDINNSSSFEVYKVGITGQPGIVGFCIAIFLCICSAYYFRHKRSGKNLILLGLGFVALLLTGKRTLFVSAIICFFILLYIYHSIILRKKLKFYYLVLLLILLLPVVIRIPAFSANLSRILSSNSIGSRADIYEVLINNFKNNPMFGSGADAYTSVMNISAHNEYLRVLAENGILGFLFFMLALGTPLIFILEAIVRNRSYIVRNWDGIYFEYIFPLLISVHWQILIMLYSLTGNPLSTTDQMLSYFIFAGLGISAAGKLNEKGLPYRFSRGI